MPNDLDVLLSVTLDTTTTPWSLDVNQANNANHLDPGPHPQRIVWTLIENAASGSFVALDAPEPGFAWSGASPPPGIFDHLQISPANINQLTMKDHHRGGTTAGTWIYILRARIGETIYSTIAKAPIGQNTNPTIKNN
ncbi:MAG TPA: hypothetical protein VL997_06840 [Dyella sp.]|nr:hypothetical protein [Dyella sp.]